MELTSNVSGILHFYSCSDITRTKRILPVYFYCHIFCNFIYFYFHGTTALSRPGPPSNSRFHDHTHTHTHTYTRTHKQEHQARWDSCGQVISTLRTLPVKTQHSQETSIPTADFEPAFPESERPQTHALGRVAIGIRAVMQTTVAQ
jgi:hypothetical protein